MLPEHEGPTPDGGIIEPPRRSVARDALSGGILGAALGAVLLGVGAVRFLAAIAGGHQFAHLGLQDVRIATYYVAGFALVGAALGAAKPLLRTRMGSYVGFALAGATIGVVAVLISHQGDATATPLTEDVTVGGTIGALMGCALARGYRRARG